MREAIVKRLKKFLFLRIVGKPTTVQEIRMTFYRVIIINVFWIDGDLPHNLEQKFEFLINPAGQEAPFPQNTMGLKHLSEDMLTYLCTNLKRPTWAGDPNVIKIKMSLSEVVQQWPYLFNLTNTKPS
jgi:hypothetical protein